MDRSRGVPFVDLVAQHAELKDELTAVFHRALASASFIGGPMVQAFEEEFGRFCGTRYCIGVGSGTDAVLFALIAGGVRPGDVVITVPHTFIATTEAITHAGALPEFVDVDGSTCNLDPDRLREYLEERCTLDGSGRPVSRRSGRPVTAIVPIHIYGQPADMDPILDLAERFNLTVIEDACQAHGAEYFSRKTGTWRKAGSIGRAAAFSFYPGKNLGACGEAGAITTDDEEVAQAARMLRDHGQSRKYDHDIEGYNGRLDAIQAGLLSAKLTRLAGWTKARRERAKTYDELLRGARDIVPVIEPDWARGVYHLYVVRVQQRAEVIAELSGAGIATGIHYPIPLHLQRAYVSLDYAPGEFPSAERAAAEVLSLPMFPQLTAEQQERVVQALLRFTPAA